MQLDIFNHSRDVMLRNDVLAALEQRDVTTSRAARQVLQQEYPQDEHLPRLAVLIDALERTPGGPFVDHDAVREARHWLTDTAASAARQVFGMPAGETWLRTLWGELARRAAPLPFRADRSDDHAAPLWLLAGDWPAAIDAIARIQSWRRIPAPLGWMAQARWRHDGLDTVWPLLAELAWLSPGRFGTLTRQLADPVIDRLRQRFNAEFEADPCSLDSQEADTELAWFPAWVLTDKPALAALLSEAQPSRHTAAERAFRLMLELLGLERQGRHHEIVQRRKELRDMQAGLYAAYLKTR